ncbi:MAG: DUF998 domain-containing protein [Ruminococcus sp.]|nr:DUF998 domain-containing protein [Ruminococcus sp.]
MNKRLLNLLGLTGVVALVSYAAAVMFAPLAYPGYDSLSQAVSDLSAEDAPSRRLWTQLAALYDICSVVCATCAAVFVSQEKCGTRLLRLGVYLFAVMSWTSAVGYKMFPLTDSGKEIRGFDEVMHIAVTAAVVLLSIASLVLFIIAGFRKGGVKSLGCWAAAALGMMFVGTIGQSVVPKDYFGVPERFSVFAAVGFNAVLGLYIFRGKRLAEKGE